MTGRITTLAPVFVTALSVMPVFSAKLWDRPDEAGTWIAWETDSEQDLVDVLFRRYAGAHASDNTSACCRTVWVAFSCLSGG
jgi:hypothetical protein